MRAVESEAPSCGVHALHPERIRRARAAIPDEAATRLASTLLKAIADPTRLRILAALSAGELCVCDLASLLGMSESAVSHQLRVLRQANLVAWRRSGRQVFYRLADDHVREILGAALEHARE